MASELAERAKEAFVDDDFNLAVDLYSQAIDLDPGNADLFVDRAQAHIKLGNYRDAISDASKAIELRPSMAKAYFRKGSACMKLGEYLTAKAALERGASLAPDDSRFTELLDECKKHTEDEIIEIKTPGFLRSAAASAVADQSFNAKSERLEQLQNGRNKAPEVNAAATVQPRYRHEFYQKPEEVVVTIFAKCIEPKDVTIDFGEQILSVSINVPGEEAYHLQPRLYGKIIPGKCRFKMLKTKIEIRLAKTEQIHWKSLEYSKEAAAPQPVNVSSVGSCRPVYPSSKNRTADWDKLEAEVKKEEKEEKLDGDAGLNKLFRDIYLNADEDMRRAMTKSFLESNGTVLSTNWKEVGEKKVEGSPPDGMELKKWEY
ncbi:protein SGT1 homolog B-like [Punica granatum]|uniref:Protein SGT1 homolog n=1 Tax=Punica granatum TaxID=22663 RepID=A0A218WIN1_PUNGR|nr:protein SGT1 homolog B-like [Punica granatum]OWM72091.1 hypothetical protein CDL15_Pgr017974 [Punica granatum]